jgi:hypothetical protein
MSPSRFTLFAFDLVWDINANVLVLLSLLHKCSFPSFMRYAIEETDSEISYILEVMG